LPLIQCTPGLSYLFDRNGRSHDEVTRFMALMKKDIRKAEKLAAALARLAK
jgi:hypothetical protein